MSKYDSRQVKGGLTQSGREQGIRRLMATNLMKRMESSVYSFNQTLSRIIERINRTIENIEVFEKKKNDYVWLLFVQIQTTRMS